MINQLCEIDVCSLLSLIIVSLLSSPKASVDTPKTKTRLQLALEETARLYVISFITLQQPSHHLHHHQTLQLDPLSTDVSSRLHQRVSSLIKVSFTPLKLHNRASLEINQPTNGRTCFPPWPSLCMHCVLGGWFYDQISGKDDMDIR